MAGDHSHWARSSGGTETGIPISKTVRCREASPVMYVCMYVEKNCDSVIIEKMIG